MPYKTRGYKKRPFKKNTRSSAMSYVPRAIKVANTAYNAMSLAAKLARFVNTEIKNFDFSINGDAISDSGFVESFFNPSQGITSDDRVGDSARPLHFTFRGTITKDATATDSHVRVIFFRGKQENGSPYVVSDILQTPDYLSPKNYLDRFRSKIIFDKTYRVDSINRPSVDFQFNTKLYGHVNFSAGSVNIENGGIWALFISSETTNTPIISYVCRTTFVDN